MPTSNIFVRTSWAVGIAATCCLAAMAVYPGGTALDPATRGYSLSRNFFSDLGSTVAYGGQPNEPGAMLFVASLAALLVGVAGFLMASYGVFAGPARSWARVAIALGVLVCIAFSGVALTPEDRFFMAHVQFTYSGFRIAPGVAAFLAVATFRDTRFPRRAGIVWVLLGAVLCGYLAVLERGPHATSDAGLVTQVVAQKLVTVAAVLALIFQSYHAARITPVAGERPPRVAVTGGGRPLQ